MSMKKLYKAKLNLSYIDLTDVSKLPYDENNAKPIPNLRDIFLMLYTACPHGVSWQLAYELSKILDESYEKIAIALEKVMHNYIEELSEKEVEIIFSNIPELPITYHEEWIRIALKKKKR